MVIFAQDSFQIKKESKMTTLELRKKVDNRVSMLSDEQLNLLIMYLDLLTITNFESPKREVDNRSVEKHNKKVLFDGRYLSEATVKLLSGRRVDDTDEERDKKIYEYIKEKYQ